jgi:SanA protein
MLKFKKFLRYSFHTLILLVVILFFLTGLMRMGMLLFSRPKTFITNDVPAAPVALVLGAGLNRDGTPGIVLQDRVSTAAELYFSGKVEKILMSGDKTEIYYNEPAAMREFAISLGVPDEDIILDNLGKRTYDSCYRAREIFKLDHLIIVTQAFHLPRALFLCHAFDIDADGVPADDAHYNLRLYSFWWSREILATINAYWDVYISHPQPTLGEPQPIFP